jgi:hypothetical protein
MGMEMKEEYTKSFHQRYFEVESLSPGYLSGKDAIASFTIAPNRKNVMMQLRIKVSNFNLLFLIFKSKK